MGLTINKPMTDYMIMSQGYFRFLLRVINIYYTLDTLYSILYFVLISRVLDLVEISMNTTEPPLDVLVDTLLALITLLEHSLVDRHQAPLEIRVRWEDLNIRI